jgi:hypothetical protein
VGARAVPFPEVTTPVETCDECGFDGREWTDADAVRAISELPSRYSGALVGLSGADRQRRPIPTMWSIAEYVDHVREVLYAMRFLLDLALDDPGADLGEAATAPFEPEPRRIDVDAALAGLVAEAEQLSGALAAAPSGVWTSQVVMNGDELDVHWIARHAVHDSTHHLGDLARLRAAL